MARWETLPAGTGSAGRISPLQRRTANTPSATCRAACGPSASNGCGACRTGSTTSCWRPMHRPTRKASRKPCCGSEVRLRPSGYAVGVCSWSAAVLRLVAGMNDPGEGKAEIRPARCRKAALGTKAKRQPVRLACALRWCAPLGILAAHNSHPETLFDPIARAAPTAQLSPIDQNPCMRALMAPARPPAQDSLHGDRGAAFNPRPRPLARTANAVSARRTHGRWISVAHSRRIAHGAAAVTRCNGMLAR